MKYLKSYKVFESRIQDLENNVQDILLELEDEGFQIEMSRISKDVEDDTLQRVIKRTDVFLEVRVSRPLSYPIFIWREVKDAIIRLTEWYYSQSIYEPIDKETIYRTDKDNSPLRFSNSGIEFGIGWSKEEDFILDDLIRFTSLRMEIKL